MRSCAKESAGTRLQVEATGFNLAEEASPRRCRELENRTRGILTVPHSYVPVMKLRDLNTTSVHRTQRALLPAHANIDLVLVHKIPLGNEPA